MRIVHVLPYYAPAWVFGGVVRASYGLTTALAAQGHAITVVTTDAGHGPAGLPANEMVAGVQVLRFPNVVPGLRRVNLSSPLGLRRRLRAVLTQADVLHVHEFRTVENLLALPLARALGSPVVMSPHGTLGYGAGRGAAKRGWDRLLGRWSAAHIDRVAALTADEVLEARVLWASFGLLLPEAQVAIVPNGVDPAEFAALPSRAVFRERWGIPFDAPLVLFMGRLHRRKGAHLLIEALPALPEVWLAVVGPDEGERAALGTLAECLDVSGRVVFTGLLTGPDQLAAFSGADLLALPAMGEGLPMVVLEAMAAGLPVAISAECHLPEVVQTRSGVQFEALEAACVAATLAPLLANPGQRIAMGQRARALVNDRFTWEAVADRMSAVYEGLVARRKA
jgi:glycosyltransferase involved in cell wall biosynthesis